MARRLRGRVPRRRAILGFAPVVVGVLFTACGTLSGSDPNAVDDGANPPSEASAPPSDATTDTAAPRPVTWPREGVYTFQQASLKPGYDDILSSKQSYGAGTVTVHWIDANCFDLTLAPRNAYTETTRLCIEGGASLVERSGERHQTLNVFVSQHVDTLVHCEPGDPYFSYSDTADDGGWSHDCTGTNGDTKTGDSGFETKGPYTFVADEKLTVMGRDVLTRHYRSHLTVTGSQTGSNDNEWWFSLEDAMLVRWLRDVSITYPAPVIGNVAYTEHADMTLVGLPDAGGD